jgi:hypothetical protein
MAGRNRTCTSSSTTKGTSRKSWILEARFLVNRLRVRGSMIWYCVIPSPLMRYIAVSMSKT